jgi:hypothetical protein
MSERDDFVAGYLAACQNLLSMFDQPQAVEEMLRESGYSRTDLLRAQRESGYRSREMRPLIRKATTEHVPQP